MIEVPVTLVSPSGHEERVTDPGRANSLMLAFGYRVKPAEPAEPPVDEPVPPVEPPVDEPKPPTKAVAKPADKK